MSALKDQVGGGHYKGMAIQPIEYIHRNGIGFAEGSVIKYVSRWREKGGVEDLLKARHFIDLLIEMEVGGGESIAPPATLRGVCACGSAPGELHATGCVHELCPHCGHQWMTCGCPVSMSSRVAHGGKVSR